MRASYCCAIDGCRTRATPPSARFLGRRVYLGAVVVLASAMQHGVSAFPGDTPHLAIQDAEGGDAATAAVDPLQARVVEHLHATPRLQPTEALRVALRVRKADLLAALRGLVDRGLVTKTERGWTLAAPTG